METGGVYESEEVFDIVFPPCDESSEVMYPGKELLAIHRLLLRRSLRPSWVRRFRPSWFGRSTRFRIRWRAFHRVGPSRTLCLRSAGLGVRLGWRSALHRYGERKTLIGGDSDDLGANPSTGWADGKALFLRSRRLHPLTFCPDSVCLVGAGAAPAADRLFQLSAATHAGIFVGRSGMEDTSPTMSAAIKAPLTR
jgi:hypothetical protein